MKLIFQLFSEQSFTAIDVVQLKLQAKLRRIDKSIRDLLKEQAEGETADGGRRELDAALAAVKVIHR